MLHVAPLSPVRSVDCAYFPSPRGVDVPHQHPYSRLRRLCVSVSLWQIPCSHKLTASLLSLCPLFRTPFLCFQELAASFCKRPGVGGRCDLSRPPVTSPLATFRTGYNACSACSTLFVRAVG